MARQVGRLRVAGTPIGNLQELTPRVAEALKQARVVVCEDTRRARSLLAHLGVGQGVELVSNHKDNEHARVEVLLARLGRGEDMVLVTDSGMPAVSDPGALLVAAARAAGITVEVLGGTTAVTHAVSGSGFEGGFCFIGFLPRKGRERAEVLARVGRYPESIVMYEAPARVVATAADLLAAWGNRKAWLARELSKLHEAWVGPTLADIAALDGAALKGECVLVVAGYGGEGASAARVEDADIVARLQAGEGVKEVSGWVAEVEGVKKSEAYARVSGLKRG